MTEQLGQRAALVLLGSMLLGLCLGLMAWGPMPASDAQTYADTRTLLGIPNALNVLTGLVMLLVAIRGVRVTCHMDLDAPVRRAWLCLQACAAVGGALATAHHLIPSPTMSLLSDAMLAVGFVLLFLSVLAERVDPRIGSAVVVASALMLVGLMVLVVPWSSDGLGHADLRPLLLMEILPLLLIPAGALGLSGHGTKATDWAAILALYALAKLFEHTDGAIFRWSGWISGQSLMHLSFAALFGWLGHCARRQSNWSVPASSATDRSTST